MKIDKKVLDRLDNLIKKGEAVNSTKFDSEIIGAGYGVDSELAYEWGASCLNILMRVFGTNSDFYKNFNVVYEDKFFKHYQTVKALGILKAAREDFALDMLFDTRVLIEAEVFDDFLEQSDHLYQSGYFGASAVIAGSVLEDGLRKLCTRNGIKIPTRPKLDKMNADLAKKGIYNKLTQKKITMLADIRNKAAHGKWDEFTKEDVGEMIRSIRSFMENYFA